jgi:dihydroflavonol-4-reductase
MVLVTGGTGLIGSHLLLHLLENGESVRAIYRSEKHLLKTKSLFDYYSKSELFTEIDWVQADILDIPSLEIAFQNVDYVYHCAGFISFDPKDENLLRKINIEGTANIVNFCIDKKVKELCHVSSIAALGNLTKLQNSDAKQTFVTEETEWNPELLHSDYAISKYGAEMEVWRGQQEGLKVVIVNPGVVFGPRFWNQGSGTFFTTVQSGIPFYTNGSTGYVAVTDVVKIMRQLMVSGTYNERFIIVSENISYRSIIDMIAKNIDASKPKTIANTWLLGLAWRLDWLFSTVFGTKRIITRQGSHSLQKTDLISNAKITSQLNYSFEGISGYLETIAEDFKKRR